MEREEDQKRIISDPDIVELFLSRNEDAIRFTKLKYGRLIDRVCFSVLNESRDSEECASTVYIKLWNTIPPEKPRMLKAYIVRIARFVSLDRFRSECRQKRISSDMTESLDDFSDFLKDDYNVEDEITRKELTSALDSFIRSLPEAKRRIFVKRYYYSMPVSTIAKEENETFRHIKKDLDVISSELKSYLKEKELI